jgi:hypothetical protein
MQGFYFQDTGEWYSRNVYLPAETEWLLHGGYRKNRSLGRWDPFWVYGVNRNQIWTASQLGWIDF